jgi:hypothetical protein
MENEVLTLGSLNIHKGPENNFEGQTTSKVKSIGKMAEFFIQGDGLGISVGYVKFINGDRDVRTIKIYKGADTFERLAHGLRLMLKPVPDNARMLYAELRQAFPKDPSTKHQTLHSTISEVDLDQGAGLAVFDELKKAGAQVGSRRELFGDTGKRAAYLCIRFSKDNLWAPIAAYVVTRILPIKLGVLWDLP